MGESLRFCVSFLQTTLTLHCVVIHNRKYSESGAMKVIMVETGEEKVVKGGEAYYVAPNHDDIVLEDTVMVEFESTAAEYYGKMTGKE